MESATDEALVRATRAGDLQAFDALYARYAQRLYSYLLRLVKVRAEAEDLVQEVFLTVLEDRTLELRPGRFAGWLFTVARNRAVERARTSARREAKATRIAQPPPSPDPEALALDKEVMARMERALSELSEPHREVLLLKAVGGLTYAQIAAVQAVPEGTAKSRVHFAVRAVRALFREDNDDPKAT
ncbi:MAG: sigma-70 family RNA polymerase sigma factor [Myxococcales bacterium]|nr:sigma-70 family RNA polymerase sigma factor [Myxococcales bacterium]MCB9652479.1 sigma-70 family RNA polymerase sigma factor [Deltaproteobacteria bacterium]